MIVIPSNIVLLPNTYFSLNAWRVFILLTSVPSLISFILIYQYPETPRYLILSGHMAQSWHVLEKIYLVNRKNTNQSYPVNTIINFSYFLFKKFILNIVYSKFFKNITFFK